MKGWWRRLHAVLLPKTSGRRGLGILHASFHGSFLFQPHSHNRLRSLVFHGCCRFASYASCYCSSREPVLFQLLWWWCLQLFLQNINHTRELAKNLGFWFAWTSLASWLLFHSRLICWDTEMTVETITLSNAVRMLIHPGLSLFFADNIWYNITERMQSPLNRFQDKTGRIVTDKYSSSCFSKCWRWLPRLTCRHTWTEVKRRDTKWEAKEVKPHESNLFIPDSEDCSFRLFFVLFRLFYSTLFCSLLFHSALIFLETHF